MDNEEVFRRLRALKPKFKDMNIKRMAVFGSRARGDARPDSDVDILIEPSSNTMTFFDMAGIQHSIEDEISVSVDLLTFDSIHPRLKKRILSEAKDV